MSDYQKMYYILCDAASKALDALPDGAAEAREILEAALAEAEERYIETADQSAE